MNGAIGLVIGAVLGVVGYRTLSALALRVEREDTRRVLGIAALAELITMPVLGVVVGAFLWPT